MRELLLVGCGGLAREVLELVRAVNDVTQTWDPIGYLDDDVAKHGSRVAGLPVLGGSADLDSHPDASVVLCTGRPGNNFSRPLIAGSLRCPPDRFATLVHPATSLASSTAIGPGTIILAGVVSTADVVIGSHVVVMPGTVLTHDDVLEDFVTVAAGVCLSGGVSVREGAYLGTGASVRGDLTIGRWALVGMGAVVTRDVPEAEVWAGVPARMTSSLTVPPGLGQV